MLNYPHHSRQTQTSQKIYTCISILVKSPRIVVRILYYFLRIGRKNRKHRTHYVSTLGKIHQLLGVSPWSNKEKSIFDRTLLRSWKYLKSRKGSASFKIVSHYISFLLPHVAQKLVHHRNNIRILVAGDKKHNSHLALLL